MGAALLGASAEDTRKTSPRGRLKDVRSGSVAAEVPAAPAAGQGRGRELCLLQGEIGRNINQCLERLERAVSSLWDCWQ